MLDKKVNDIINICEEKIIYRFKEIDEVSEYNTQKVLSAMQQNKLSARHFMTSVGYGYDDEGRDVLEKIFADVFKGELALVRPQIVSGTHAISLMLYAVLRPNDNMLSISADPYDTIKATIGINEKTKDDLGSLKDFNISYNSVKLKEDGEFDFLEIEKNIKENTKVIYIQRSSGYDNRKAITIKRIEEVIKFVREKNKDLIICIDNCYGEFIEKREPLEVGADLIAGSLIKNPGGGIATTGGYVIGKEKYMQKVASRLSAPSIKFEVGSNFGLIRSYAQGLFMASKVTAEALKGAILAASVFSHLGYEVFPDVCDERSDIIQGIKLLSKEKVKAYCKGIQMASPVDSYVTPEEWDMPGYDDKIIMAAGNFIDGSSIELSADARMKEPFNVYHQGGLNYEHAKIGIKKALKEILKLK